MDFAFPLARESDLKATKTPTEKWFCSAKTETCGFVQKHLTFSSHRSANYFEHVVLVSMSINRSLVFQTVNWPDSCNLQQKKTGLNSWRETCNPIKAPHSPFHTGGLAEIVNAWMEPERSSSSNRAFTMRWRWMRGTPAKAADSIRTLYFASLSLITVTSNSEGLNASWMRETMMS